jgi:hypothetical protein
MNPLYTDESLAEAAARCVETPGGPEAARATYKEMASSAEAAGNATQAADNALTALRQNRGDIQLVLGTARTNLDALVHDRIKMALADPSGDHAGHACLLENKRALVRYLSDTLAYADQLAIPTSIIELRRAEEAFALAAFDLASQKALISAVERHLAAKPMIDAEGVVSFQREGRTYERLEASWRAHGVYVAARDSTKPMPTRQRCVVTARRIPFKHHTVSKGRDTHHE